MDDTTLLLYRRIPNSYRLQKGDAAPGSDRRLARTPSHDAGRPDGPPTGKGETADGPGDRGRPREYHGATPTSVRRNHEDTPISVLKRDRFRSTAVDWARRRLGEAMNSRRHPPSHITSAMSHSRADSTSSVSESLSRGLFRPVQAAVGRWTSEDRITMSDRPSHNLGGLDVDTVRQIDEVCRRFEAALAGRPPRAHRGLPGRRSLRGPTRASGRTAAALEREMRESEETVAKPSGRPCAVLERQTTGSPSTIAESPTMAPGTLPGHFPHAGCGILLGRRGGDRAARQPAGSSREQPTTASPRARPIGHSSARLNRHRIRYFGDYELLRGDRPRRHGRRLQGPAGEPQPAGRPQDDPRRPARRRGRRAALPHRGRGRRQPRPSQHRADLRGRRARGPALLLA